MVATNVPLELGVRIFFTDMEHEHTWTFYMIERLENMATVRNSEVESHKFKTDKICTKVQVHMVRFSHSFVTGYMI